MSKQKAVTPSAGADSNPHRLPTTVLPSNYDLTIVPDFHSNTFTGEVTIRVNVTEPVSATVLNVKELEVQEAHITYDTGTRLNGSASIDPKLERLTINYAGILGIGECDLRIKFTGILNDKLRGFYRSTYMDAQGTEQKIGCTQFEAAEARRAFPCWDEPAFKATYKLTMIVDEDLMVISNTLAESETVLEETVFYIADGESLVTRDGALFVQSASETTDGNGVIHQSQTLRPVKRKKKVEFERTILLSTYLLAFIVGKFERSEIIEVEGLKLMVYTPPGSIHLSARALRVAAFGIKFFTRLFKIRLPGKIMQLIAIPDFENGAMENYACITFRPTALLVNPATASQKEILRVDEVVLHELAHQWFGDLVTMKWWNSLGFNEYNATFWSYVAMAEFNPEAKMFDIFAIMVRARAMALEALKSTHAVETPVETPEQAESGFDAVTYEGGASRERMIQQYLGEGVFLQAFCELLRKNLFGNVDTLDIWNELSTAAGKDLEQMMDAWIFKPGFPLVTVGRAAQPGCFTFSQQSFKYLQDGVDKQQLWPIPISIRCADNHGSETQELLLTEREAAVYLGESTSLVQANAGGNGYFRTRYTGDLLAKLTESIFPSGLAQAVLPVVDRFNLVADTWACVRAGLTDVQDYLNLIKHFGNEDNPNVWQVIAESLSTLKGVLPADKRPSFEQFVRKLAGPAFEGLGWVPINGETPQQRQLRGQLVTLLGITGNDTIVQGIAQELFQQCQLSNSQVDSEVLPSIVSIVAVTGGKQEYDNFFKLYKTAATPQDELRFLMALASFRNLDLLKQTLEMTLNPEMVRTQDAPSLVARVMMNDLASTYAWDFVKKNWEHMVKIYPNKGVIRMVEAISALSTPELEADTTAFLATHPVKDGEKAVPTFLEHQHINTLFRQKVAASVAAYFEKA